MSVNPIFTPVQADEAKIRATDKQPGWLYFATDTGRMYLDTSTERITVGGSGAAIYYANGSAKESEEEEGIWIIEKDALSNQFNTPALKDIILNENDGGFYRVDLIIDDAFYCTRLSVSGGGGGGTIVPSIVRPSLKLDNFYDSNIINGSDVIVYFTATSANGSDGLPLADELTITWKLFDGDSLTGIMYKNGTLPAKNGEKTPFNFGPYLRNSTTSTLQLIATGINHDEQSAKREITVSTTDLTLTLDPDFSNTSPFDPDRVIFQVEASGYIDKKMEVRFDGNVVKTVSLKPNENWNDDIVINSDLCTHGHHSIRVDLYPVINGVQGKAVTPIIFEIAVNDGVSEIPIVWLGTYQNTYYTYDSIQIPYLAYDPTSPSKAQVYLYKNGVQYPDDIREVTSRNRFQIWEISDADNEATNYYQIASGNTNDKRKASQRDITFEVLQDTRDLTVASKANLRLNFDPKGRSNTESKTSRSKWNYTANNGTIISAIFDKFNWENNGWDMDSKNNTFLRISNGAKFFIPIGTTRFSEQSHTFEIMFKIRNVQNYESLVKNVTRYYLNSDMNETDDVLYNEYIGQTNFDNYDAFLQWKLGPQYDDLVYRDLQKILNIDNAVCKYCDGEGQNILGWALGAQDAFFRDGQKAISVSYVDEDLVSLSIVYKYDPTGKNMILFYLNGVLTGTDYTSATAFSIGEQNPSIEFNSEFCDIDLYKLRVYNTNLDVNEIVQNYTVDRKDINNFDLIKLAKKNANTSEYQIQYNQVIEWNKNNPTNQTMPYIIFDTTNDSISNKRLPWSKATSMNTTVTFVNTQLDQAYASGELEELAIKDKLCKADDKIEIKTEAIKTYYKHHCPSWTGNNCELTVQGTSSEYYPRRNYKIKTKTDKYEVDGEERIHIFLNQGPFAEDYRKDPESTRQKFWYMNNYTNGTHKWTMKVDYMESSGSYNAGFASMVGNCYTKHPLKDYLDNNAINSTVTEYKKDENGEATTEIKKIYNGLVTDINFTEKLDTNELSNSNIRWQDYRTSLLGFPVMAFHKRAENDYVFIGYYRMLLDKGSDEVLGFKPAKGVTANFLGGKDVRKKAECWEFSNNNRTYCSYRDPEDRNQLSFMPSEKTINDRTGLTAAGIPIVADCFEYRYNDNEDFLDILYNLGKYDENAKKWNYAGSEEHAADFLKETGIDITSVDNWPAAREKMVDYYKNWEKVCQWIWSTCIENVVSMGVYQIAPVGNIPFTTDGSLYKENNEGGFDLITENDVFDISIVYYTKTVNLEDGTIEWNRVYVYDIDDNGNSPYSYEANKFYQNIDGVYSLVTDSDFNPDIKYYELIIDESYKNKSDLLVARANEWDDSGATKYYTWDPSVTTKAIRDGNPSVKLVTNPVKEQFDAGLYYIESPVTYGVGNGAKTYYYDTQEYRAEKFIKELSSHFDLEYLATYFIMTEVFECYDSRGKNCMMASWGPLKEGGEYIWYPIFYDIDTQLGINNTGIPSFEFNVDVTLKDNFSTSDSILWNNFYSFFKGSYILQKYKHLKGEESIIFTRPLASPPLKSVANIESWYLFDPDVTDNIAARGLRPLIATNLDTWYKYITTTNIAGSSNPDLLGDVGYLGRNGEWLIDTDGKFYMLQGDRSQSRQSFLTKRIDYIDSWLGVGGYQRSGSNCIWGRVSANDLTDTSDKWMEGVPAGEQYWKDINETEKTHEFDAQYWLDLTPLYSTYVTVSDDAAAYPPMKYDGITPTHMEISAIESGVRKSKNYREQLLYIYGSDKMLDIGDMSNLYWREFRIDGKASKLTRLKLGHDGISNDYIYDADGNKVYSEMTWKNGYLNKPNFPSGLGSTGMPLLKEVNFCNITIQAGESDPTFDFSTCEKLKNFRATGSNITQVTFAKGVALDTLYLPPTIKSLSLQKANLLTNVLKTYTRPIKNSVTGKLEALPGLYLESFFEDNPASQLFQLNLEGGALGYGSFDLFSRFYDLRKSQTGNRLTMTDVNWCPYVQLVEGDTYTNGIQYYYDNGHYGFEEYEYVDDNAFNAAIVRGELYYLDIPYIQVKENETYNSNIKYYYYDTESSSYSEYEYTNNEDFNDVVANGQLYRDKSQEVKLATYNKIKNLITNSNFKSYENDKIHTNLSGIIYIDNSDEDEIDEYELSDTITKAYPNLKIFMSKVKSAYSAQFVILNDNGSYTYVPDSKGDVTYKSIQKISQNDYASGTTTFKNPFNEYDPSESKNHYTFIGWTTSLTPDLVKYSNVLLESEKNYWGITDTTNDKYNYKGTTWGVINPEVVNQIYYAVYIGRTYTATFIDKENPNYHAEVKVQYNPNGSYFHANVMEPISIKPVDSLELRYALKGWTATENYGGHYASGIDISEYLVDVSKYPAINNTTKFYAVFQSENVYDVPTNSKYFGFDDSKGYPVIYLKPESGNNLVGKITLPLTDPNGNYIKGIGNMFHDGNGKPLGKNITHIFFQKNKEDIGQYSTVLTKAFYNPTQSSNQYQIKGIYLPETIRIIEDFAFQYQLDVEDITLNNNIISIGSKAFDMGFNTNGAGSMHIDTLPSELETLGEGAFIANKGLSINKLPKKLEAIPNGCFKWCPNIYITEFGSDDSILNSIGKQAFDGSATNTGLSSLYIHKNIKTIDTNAFYNYGEITDIYVHDTNADLWNSENIIKIFGKQVNVSQLDNI